MRRRFCSQDAEARNAPKAHQSRAEADAQDRTRILRNMAEDRMDVSAKKPKKAPAAAPTPPPQLIVRVRRADGSVTRVAFDGAPTLDDLRARSGAAELFADEALTRACAAADLVHGAVVYAPPDGDAVADGEEGGDAMADEG